MFSPGGWASSYTAGGNRCEPHRSWRPCSLENSIGQRPQSVRQSTNTSSGNGDLFERPAWLRSKGKDDLISCPGPYDGNSADAGGVESGRRVAARGARLAGLAGKPMRKLQRPRAVRSTVAIIFRKRMMK